MERESEGWQKLGLVVSEILQRLGTNSLDPETVADALQGLIDRSSRKTARTITPRVNLAPDVGDPVDQSQDRGRLLSNALRMVEKGQFQKAIDLYKQLLEIEPKDSRVHLKIGDLFLKTGETELAVGAYAEVARLYEEQGFYKKAIAVRKQIVSIVPSRVEHQRRLIALYHVVGLSAEFSEALNQLAKTYQEQGNDNSELVVYLCSGEFQLGKTQWVRIVELCRNLGRGEVNRLSLIRACMELRKDLGIGLSDFEEACRVSRIVMACYSVGVLARFNLDDKATEVLAQMFSTVIS